LSTDTTNHDKENYTGAKEKVLSSLKDYFRPEFLNRLDDIIIFDILGAEAIRKIVDIQVAEVKKRLSEKGIDLILGEEVYSELAREGYNPQYGARPLKRLIQSKILTPVANLLISQEVVKGGTINVHIKNGEYVFDNKKKRKSEGVIYSEVAPRMG
jgi:ATP-dependent Clp protease ATP-binding subunit ClpA